MVDLSGRVHASESISFCEWLREHMELDSDEESEVQGDVEDEEVQGYVEDEEEEQVVYKARSGRISFRVNYNETAEDEEDEGEGGEDNDTEVEEDNKEPEELSEYEKQRLQTLESNERILKAIMKGDGSHGSSLRISGGSTSKSASSDESSSSNFEFRPIQKNKESKKIKQESDYFHCENESSESDSDLYDCHSGDEHNDEGSLWSFQKRFPRTSHGSKESEEIPEVYATKYYSQLREVGIDSCSVFVFCPDTYYILHRIRDTEHICSESSFLQDDNGNAFSFAPDFCSICGVHTAHKYMDGSNLICVMEEELDTVVFSSKFKIHYEQIYDRVLFPHGTRKTSSHRVEDLYARVGETKRECFLRLKLFDSRGRDISFRIKGDVTSNSHVYNQDVCFAPPGKQRTESNCSLVYLLMDSNSKIIMFVCYPLKMCNSFHTISSSTECQRRGITMEELMIEKHLKKQRKRGRS